MSINFRRLWGELNPGEPAAHSGMDYPLLFTVIGMVGFGLLMVYSSSFIYAQDKTGDGFSFIRKQMIYAALGFGVLFSAFRLDYRLWAKWSYYVAGFALLMLVMVLIPGVGSRVLGAQRWIRLGPFNFQPGEFAKFAIIIFVANQLARKESRIHVFAAGIMGPLLIPIPAMALLLLQPDFGTTVMITMVIFALMFLAGVPKRFLASAVILAGTAASVLVLGSTYRRTRLLGYLDPWADPGGKGFQIIQSLVGLHNGHFWGVGLGNGKEKLFYLPEAHNDFIFAVIGEELGFLGIAAVIAAYLYFIHRGLRIAYECHKNRQDRFGMLLASGITLALGLQGFVNIAVVMGLLPTKGLTLPFISYGGSALMVDLFAIGILLSIARGPIASEKIPRAQ